MKKDYIEIDGKKIGPAYTPYVVAELSANHNGSLDNALKAIKVAFECGADAIKLQTYTPDTMTIDCDHEDFQIKGGVWDGHQLYSLYQSAHTPYEWHEVLFAKARELGITLFSTPFDETAVALLEHLNTPAYKIASFELTDLALIKRVAQTGKPMIMSTGMANLVEIKEAVMTANNNGCNDLILLHCVSGYPTPMDQINLAKIPYLAQHFSCLVGLSDHTLGTTASIASVALGATFIEKHFILDRKNKGPDFDFSIEPEELRHLVNETKAVHAAVGQPDMKRQHAEEANLKFRRSLYFVKDLKAGDKITVENMRRIRPGYGLAPKHWDTLLGKSVIRDIVKGTAVQWDLISSE